MSAPTLCKVAHVDATFDHLPLGEREGGEGGRSGLSEAGTEASPTHDTAEKLAGGQAGEQSLRRQRLWHTSGYA